MGPSLTARLEAADNVAVDVQRAMESTNRDGDDERLGMSRHIEEMISRLLAADEAKTAAEQETGGAARLGKAKRRAVAAAQEAAAAEAAQAADALDAASAKATERITELEAELAAAAAAAADAEVGILLQPAVLLSILVFLCRSFSSTRRPAIQYPLHDVHRVIPAARCNSVKRHRPPMSRQQSTSTSKDGVRNETDVQ